MADDSSLELRSVLERFEASSEALEDLRQRLLALALAEETQGRAATALDSTAQRVEQFSAEAAAAVVDLQRASVLTSEAMTAAATFLQGTDLSGLHEAVRSVETTVAGLSESSRAQTSELGQLRSAIANFETRLTGEVAAAQREASEAKAALAALQAKVGAVPERARKKAGL